MRHRILTPTAFLSGLFAFGLLFLQAGVARAVLPHLLELLRTAPRLAIFGFIGLVTLPAVTTFVVHRFGSKYLDRFTDAAGKSRSIESAWAGALAWLVMYGTTILARLLFLVINPPEPNPDAFSLGDEVMSVLAQMSPANAFSLYAGLWIAVATVLFELEQRARKAR